MALHDARESERQLISRRPQLSLWPRITSILAIDGDPRQTGLRVDLPVTSLAGTVSSKLRA